MLAAWICVAWVAVCVGGCMACYLFNKPGVKPSGIDLTLGSGTGDLWYNGATDPVVHGLGFRVGIRWGQIAIRFPLLWKWNWIKDGWPAGMWNWDKASGPMKWWSGSLRFVVLPFVSLNLFTWANLYLGAKYNGWGKDDWLILSATIRIPEER